MKKIFLLAALAALALAIDGALDRGLFALPVDSFGDALLLFLLVFIVAAIVWADQAKKSGDENIQR